MELTPEENRERLRKRIEQLDIDTETVIAFDFSELLVPIHMARQTTDPLSDGLDEEKLEQLGPGSMEGIRYIRNQFTGTDYETYAQRRDRLAVDTPFREGIRDLLQALQEEYTVLVLSSGLKDVCMAKLQEIGFNSSHVISGELRVENGEIVGSDLILTSELKAAVIEQLNEEHRTVAVGHSEGDRLMLDAADLGIAFPPDTSNLGDVAIETVDALQETIADFAEHQ